MKKRSVFLKTVAVFLASMAVFGFTACTDVTTEAGTDTPEDTATDTAATAAGTNENTTAAPETTEGIVDRPIGETLDAECASDFTVSKVFSNDMVVQRNEFIRVWGWAPESENGKKVSGEFMGMFAEAIIENGEWEITFTARLSANGELGNSMRIYAGENKEYVFTNVLVGDVYMVIGQSNVAAPVISDPKVGVSVADNHHPIRIHYNSLGQTNGYPQRGTEEVCKDLLNGSVWKLASAGNIANFSAIGYYFAYHLMNITEGQVPLGIIEIDGNGQPLGAFMPNEVAEACKTDKFNKTKGYYVTSGVNADGGRYMYNHYMYPFERYAMAGIVWYQGESDLQSANYKVFADNFTAMMKHIRGTHNLVDPDFPVYIVEFPTIYTQPAGFKPTTAAPMWAYMDVGIIRSVLGAIPGKLENSYVSVSSDLWTDKTFWNNLHPNCKYDQGLRVAQLASAVGYGISSLDEVTGPILVKMELSEDGMTAILTYDNVGEGLTTSDGGTAVKGFGVAKTRYGIISGARVNANITAKNQITLTSDKKFAGVVYNYVTTNFYGNEINLCNSYGCPASAVFFYGE